MHGKNVVIIPARLDSSRLPKKALLKESGKYLIQHVYEQALKSKLVDFVLVATDSGEIQEACKDFGANCILTSRQHESGTDRVAEAVKDMYVDNIVNVQGDEPLIDPAYIDLLFQMLSDRYPSVDYATLACPIATQEEYLNPNVVKVVLDNSNCAIYFSRAPIPSSGFTNALRHIGIYGYTKKGLMEFAKSAVSRLEKIERLEQLRLIENRSIIDVSTVMQPTLGIDTREDYDKFLAIIAERRS